MRAKHALLRLHKPASGINVAGHLYPVNVAAHNLNLKDNPNSKP
jgi:hypothetical protein